MRIRAWLVTTLLIAGMSPAAQFESALPGYRFQFPRDHFSHPNYKTEWWYYTGNLRATDGHRFGFELTFFRIALDGVDVPVEGVWTPSQFYLAHLALSDIDGQKFLHIERLNRAGPGIAGVSFEAREYWNTNWRVHWISDNGEQQLEAVTDKLKLHLHLTPQKPLVVHGQNGISPKGPKPGEASHYISFTRLATSGTLAYNGHESQVGGTTWMDHEFSTEPLDPSLRGWDWFAIQLDNNEELMLYRLRSRSGEQNPFSSGTFIDSRGSAHYLDSTQFELTPGATWTSSTTSAHYPTTWLIRIPSLELELTESTALLDQELAGPNNTAPSYWEGAVTYTGRLHNAPIHGIGYLEMTGYDRPITTGLK